MDRLTEIGRKYMPDGFWGGETVPGSARRQIFLTFDDGPCPHTTPRLLETLAEAGVQATFFLIGSSVARHPELVERIAGQGHVIANHSFSHPLMPALSTRAIEQEIDTTNRRIEEVTGSAPSLFRPPYGVCDRRSADCLSERGMVPVYWGVVPLDWQAPGAERVVHRVMRRLEPGALVVMHERRALSHQTVTAAKEIICKGRQLGYEFVEIPGAGFQTT